MNEPASEKHSLRAVIASALPALGLLGLALGLGAAARAYVPSVPTAVVFAFSVLVALSATLLPRFRRLAFVALLYENEVFFVAGVATALVWANADLASYARFKAFEVELGPVRVSFEHLVNEGLMVFFFGVAAKEVREALLPGGPLASGRRAALPLLATAGGMAGPALLYVALAHGLGRPDLVRGWAIPTATDIAFSAIVARFVFGAAHPAIPFLLLLAIADDAGGLAILAVAYPQHDVHFGLLLGLLGAAIVAGLVLDRALSVKSPWPYVLLAGGLAWAGLRLGGLHPALALVPIVFVMPVPPHARDSGIFDTATGLSTAPTTLERFQESLAAPVSLILGVFGLVNAGVPLRGVGTATTLVLAGLVVGKPLGISVAVAVGRRAGLELAEGLGTKEVLVLGVAAGIGFTVALFVATAAGLALADLDAAKMGALGSVASGLAAVVLGRALGVVRRP